MSLWFLLLIIIGCLALEGFFSGSEIALVSARRARLTHRAERGSRSAKKVLRLMREPQRLLSTTLMGTNLCTVTATFAANELFARLWGKAYAGLALLVIFPATLILGEVIPKTLYRMRATSIALIVIYPLHLFRFLFYPVASIASILARGLTYLLTFSGGKRYPYITKEELKLVISTEPPKDVTPDESRMVYHLLSLSATKAGQIMTPLSQVAMVREESSPREVVQLIHGSGFSRIPVYKSKTSNLIGIVHAKDLIRAPASALQQENLSPFIREGFEVSEKTKIDKLLKLLQARKMETTFVVNKKGEAVGVVTLEDILEEVVGEIADEFDHHPPSRPLSPASD